MLFSFYAYISREMKNALLNDSLSSNDYHRIFFTDPSGDDSQLFISF